MGAGFWVLGAVFCLLGTVVLAVLAFFALRYFVETGRGGEDTRVPAHAHRWTEDQLGS